MGRADEQVICHALARFKDIIAVSIGVTMERRTVSYSPRVNDVRRAPLAGARGIGDVGYLALTEADLNVGEGTWRSAKTPKRG